MQFGRLIKVVTPTVAGAEPREQVYVVAEQDSAVAITIIRQRIAGAADHVEAVGRASEQLLRALGLAPGQFTRADPRSVGRE
jgi:hypothetical protein